MCDLNGVCVPFLWVTGLSCSSAVVAYERLVGRCRVRGIWFIVGGVNICHPV